jgi:hypothetical protein
VNSQLREIILGGSGIGGFSIWPVIMEKSSRRSGIRNECQLIFA